MMFLYIISTLAPELCFSVTQAGSGGFLLPTLLCSRGSGPCPPTSFPRSPLLVRLGSVWVNALLPAAITYGWIHKGRHQTCWESSTCPLDVSAPKCKNIYNRGLKQRWHQRQLDDGMQGGTEHGAICHSVGLKIQLEGNLNTLAPQSSSPGRWCVSSRTTTIVSNKDESTITSAAFRESSQTFL